MNIYVFGTRGFPGIQGGVEKHCERMYPCMPEGYSITVCRRNAYTNKQIDTQYPNIRFVDLPSTRIKGVEAFYHSFLCTIYCLIKRPDIVHIHNIGPGIFIPLLKSGKRKVILTYHSPNYEHDKWNTSEKKFLRISENIALRYADRIIFINEQQQQKYAEDILRKSALISNGVDKQERLTTPSYIHELALTPYKYILAVGRITPEKGFDYLIDAFCRLNRSDITLVIAGGIDHGSSYAKNLEARVNGNVIFTGFIEGDQLQELYSFARLFILPSHNEGYPLVLLEAANYQLPILASDIPANRQIGFPEEQYFPVGSSTALQEKITRELEKEETTVTYNIQIPTWNEIAGKVARVYEQCLSDTL